MNKLNCVLILFKLVAVSRKLIKTVLASSLGKVQAYFPNYINQHDRNTKDLLHRESLFSCKMGHRNCKLFSGYLPSVCVGTEFSF